MIYLVCVVLILLLAVAVERSFYWFGVAQQQSSELRKQWRGPPR